MDLSLESRFVVDRAEIHFPLKFQTSISKDGRLVASTILVHDNLEDFFPVYLLIKSVATDRTVHLIPVLGSDDLDLRLSRDCRRRGSICPHWHEVEQRAAAANAVLARYEWRPFPCSLYTGPSAKRDGAGCDNFRDLESSFDDARLKISLRERVLVDRKQPAWDKRNRCTSRTIGGPEAFDPQTGILLIGVSFLTDGCACSGPMDDFHAIRMPALRADPGPALDGGAP